MNRVRLLLLSSTCALMLGLPHPATAAPYRPIVPWRPIRPVRPVKRGRMPGWDWWRIYPWSPYNYGRNPYNPIILPYPYPYPSYYGGYPPAYNDDEAADGTMFPSHQGQRVLMPHPTGEMKGTPPDAAVILVRVPDPQARVLFDGERTYTVGTKRYFATPALQEGKTYSYTVTATWKEDGRMVTRERDVRVAIGTTTVVDFRAQRGE